jgi:hypothetical protein
LVLRVWHFELTVGERLAEALRPLLGPQVEVLGPRAVGKSEGPAV